MDTRMSASSGVGSMNYRIMCTSDSDCDTPWEYCGIRAKASSSYCISPAYGMSHAWAPASIREKYASYEVWNQLVDGFKVYEQDVMTPEEAAHSLKSYPWNKDAKSIVHVKSRLSWSNATFAGRESEVDEQTGTGADFEYLLEMDDVDQIIGGEWLNKSNDDYPDFLWFPEGKPAVDTVTSIS
ncbi:Transglutaminase elicitor [Phytophthora cactorum]|nr:Transglutaminase elicitor [Phytophthora cactorum]